jgi:Kdo2-lipid IVA lauroyltransferase/acyltransferase
MLYYLVKALSVIIIILPERLRNFIGDVLGALCWPFVSRRRLEMAIGNAASCLGLDRAAAYTLVKQSAVRFGRMFMEVLYFPRLNRDNIHQWVRIVGEEHIVEALSYGRGAILATAHSGNWELLGAALAQYGYPIVGVAQRQTNAEMDRFINEYRTLTGMHITYKTGIREMISLLGQGKIIGLIMDQDAKEQGIFVEFFGRMASTPSGATALARMKDSPIMPTFITRNADGTHTVIVHTLEWVEKTANRDADLTATTQKLCRLIEQHIRTYPHEWFWLHNRWKTRPPEERKH